MLDSCTFSFCSFNYYRAFHVWDCLCIIWFHGSELYQGQVCWMPVLVTWSSALCCFVALSEGHVELILGEPHPLFISDPMLCQLDRTPSMCGSRESFVKFIWIGRLSRVPNVPILKNLWCFGSRAQVRTRSYHSLYSSKKNTAHWLSMRGISW